MARKRITKKVTTLVRDYVQSLKKSGVVVSDAYIFGSQARGTAHSSSDIDVCIISPQFKNPHDALRTLWRKKTITFSQIEPVGYSKKNFDEFSNPLVSEIKKNHVRVI